MPRVLPGLITLALRRARTGTGSSRRQLDTRSAMLPLPDLSFLPVPWVIVGGVALRAYAPERMTLDLDILIAEADVPRARRAFEAAGYQLAGELSIGGLTFIRADAPGVDVLFGSAPWTADALAHPVYDRAGYPVIPLPYLVLMKLEAGRSIDMGDLSRLIGLAPAAERTLLRQTVERYRPDLLEDYDALVQLADLEFGHGLA